ncbi:MAG: DUF5455 family protein [Desulfuromonas thiophila]|nr:DUF5455 family protein [Desulfuromonas thiophila]
MPVLGLARLAGFLTGVFSSIFTLLAEWLGKKAALTLTAIGFFLAALAALWAAISTLLGSIAAALPTGGLMHWVFVGMNLAIPDNFEVCVAAMLAADLAVYLYRWNMQHILEPKV